ncbi:MAG: GNAT family N-acetyltransferase [Polyangiaceae bacterium]
MTESLIVRPLQRADAHGLAALFERTGSPCYCRWWHFSGDKNAWQDRCANRPEESRQELTRAVEAGSEEARGIVALSDTTIVAWMKLSPRTAVDKLYSQRLYRGLPCFEGAADGVWTIGCFLVDEAFRGRGVAERILRAGLEEARRAGATSVEAFPRRADDLAAEEKWTGSYGTLRRAGFAVVNDFGPYPVLRCELSGS